jgi:TolB-like protein
VFAEPSAPEATPAGERILLAVERLKWLGGPDGQDYLAVGLTDELVTTLSCYGDNLTVVRAPADGLGMAAGFESRPDCLAYQLLGSVRQEGDDIRICIRLVEAADGLVAWSETFAHRLSPASLLAILEQVARQVAATVLDPHGILYQSLKRKTAPLLGSYLAVFRYHEYQERFAPQTHLRAREALEQSVREDPGYADAWAALANVYLGEALFGVLPQAHLLVIDDASPDGTGELADALAAAPPSAAA